MLKNPVFYRGYRPLLGVLLILRKQLINQLLTLFFLAQSDGFSIIFVPFMQIPQGHIDMKYGTGKMLR